MLTATHISGLRAWLPRQQVVLGLVLCVLATGAWAEPVQALFRPTRNTWVVDATSTLASGTLAEVDRLGTEVERSGRGQLVVAVVFSTDGRPPRPYATELFNRWGIGHARRNDGALLFIALKDRKAEIILGDGVDTREDVERSRKLMREVIAPAFREGAPDTAVKEGARGLKELLERAPLNRGLGMPLALEEHPVAAGPTKPEARKDSRSSTPKPGGKESRPPERKKQEFLDDEGMYVELSTSDSSEGEDASATAPMAEDSLPLTGSSSQRNGTSPGSPVGGTTAVSPMAWAVVAGFILLLVVANLLRRRGVACERCGSRNVKVSTSTLLDAGDHHEGLVELTVHCRRCGHVGLSTRQTSSRRHWHGDSHSHSGSHRGSSGGRSSGGGSSGTW